MNVTEINIFFVEIDGVLSLSGHREGEEQSDDSLHHVGLRAGGSRRSPAAPRRSPRRSEARKLAHDVEHMVTRGGRAEAELLARELSGRGEQLLAS